MSVFVWEGEREGGSKEEKEGGRKEGRDGRREGGRGGRRGGSGRGNVRTSAHREVVRVHVRRARERSVHAHIYISNPPLSFPVTPFLP